MSNFKLIIEEDPRYIEMKKKFYLPHLIESEMVLKS